MSAFSKGLGKKVRLGRYGMPIWAIAAALVAVTAVAGQALGPVLAGSAGGNVGVVASQNIFFQDVVATKGHNGDIDQAAANIDTSGLILQGAFRMHRGDYPSTLDITLENRGGDIAGARSKSAKLTVTRPAGTSVDLRDYFGEDPSNNADGCGIAQSAVMVGNGVEIDTYLVTVPENDTVPEDGCHLYGRVTVGTAEPLGSYNISMELEEIP